MIDDDTYKTIQKVSVGQVYKDKKSKFIGVSTPFVQLKELNYHLSEVKKKFKGAHHYCYAYKLGTTNITHRANDDGEPKNSAGLPILGQIESFKLTNILVVVVRYYGGVNLGVGGLISAYKNAAKLVLNQSTVINKTIEIPYLLCFSYNNMHSAMKILNRYQVNITKTEQNIKCDIYFMVRKSKCIALETHFKNNKAFVLKKL